MGVPRRRHHRTFRPRAEGRRRARPVDRRICMRYVLRVQLAAPDLSPPCI